MDRMKIDAVLSGADLRTLAEQAGCEFTRSGHSTCPLHNGTNAQQFHVWTGTDGRQMWTCFGDCGESGDAIDFVMKWRRLDFRGAVEFLGGSREIDPAEMIAAATERAKRAEAALIAHIAEAQAALADLQHAQRHLAYYEEMKTLNRRQLWRDRGVRDDIQDWLYLGYHDQFRAETKTGTLITNTLTIPIFGKGRELLNIRHRLLNAIDGDKYRPERTGLGLPPLLFDPDLGYDAERIVWIEGEIKAIVTGQTLDTPGVQVAGVAGISNWKQCVDCAQGKRNWVIFDPGAEKHAIEFAKAIGGRVVFLPGKIDDMINAASLNREWVIGILKSARKA